MRTADKADQADRINPSIATAPDHRRMRRVDHDHSPRLLGFVIAGKPCSASGSPHFGRQLIVTEPQLPWAFPLAGMRKPVNRASRKHAAGD